tara:strand:+ start:197 stop:949 length:753 start_codon:yes stop_codon:yes gene_type:complete
MPEQALKDKVTLVTGGAGGIGTAICQHLAAAGATIVVGYRGSRAEAEALAKALPGEGHIAMPALVESSDALDTLAVEIEDRLGRLDILVNNAGTTRFVPHNDLDGLDDALIDQIFRVNWRGPFACVRAFRSLLEAGEGGLVINISSIAGATGMGSNIAYCASKAGLNTMTVSLARALAPKIRVVSVSPGVVETDFTRSFDESWRREQESRTPLGRLGHPDDVGKACLAVAASLTFTTGSIIPIDGGRPLT